MQVRRLAKLQMHIFLMMLYLLGPHFAIAATKTVTPQVRISLIQNGQPAFVNWTYQVSALWEKNSKDETEFFWAVTVDVPDYQSILRASTSIDPTSEFFEVKKIDTRKGRPLSTPKVYFDPTGGITFKTSALSQTFMLETRNGRRVQMTLDLKITRPLVIADNCDDSFLKIVPKSVPSLKDLNELKPGPSLPTYLAYRCEKKDSGLTLAVAVPLGVEWASNSLFESKGKGQSWKNFELNPQTSAGKKDVIGEFIFEQNTKRYSYSVIVEKIDPKGSIAKFRLSLGAASYSISKESVSDSAVKPAADVAFEVRPFWPQLSIGGNGLATIPFRSGNYFVHSETSGYLGWTFKLKDPVVYEPRIYIYMAEGLSQNLNYFYKVSTPAIGGTIRFSLPRENVIEAEGLFMKQKTSSITSLRMCWSSPLTFINKWGVTAIIQKIEITGADLIKASATQIYLGGNLDF